MNNVNNTQVNQRPWWSVRTALLATLTALVGVLVVIVSHPDMVDRGLHIAGL